MSRRLSPAETEALDSLLATVRTSLDALAGGDGDLLFAFRKRLYTRLMQLEHSTPVERKTLKAQKRKEQNGLCAICEQELPKKGAELERLVDNKGYTRENTRLVHHECRIEEQRKKAFSDAIF